MKNWRTTLFGLAAFVMVNGDALGIPPKAQKVLEGASIAFLGFVSKDKNVTGVGTEARSQDDLGIKG